MRYLFHNIYGDADELIATAPADVECIPFGWTPEIEQAREDKLRELGTGVSVLPSLLYWTPEYTIPAVVDPPLPEAVIAAHWAELRIADMEPAQWTWPEIDTATEAAIAATRAQSEEGSR